MLARIQQLTVAAWLGLVLLWLTSDFWHSLTWTLVALLLFFGHAAFLLVEFALSRWHNRLDPAAQANLGTLLRAWLLEAQVAPRVFAWQQPFRSRVWADHLPRPSDFQDTEARPNAPRRGFVFIHGFACNRGLWNPWLAQLQARGDVFCAINLEPLLGSIDRYAPLIDTAVRRVHAATGLPVVLVCHSMGGLAARAWLQANTAEHLVHRVVTLATPHHGTWLSHFAQSVNARQMQIGSRWLAQLAQQEPAARRALFICYYTNCDNIVFPSSTAAWPGADNRFITGVSHIALVFDARVMGEVLALSAPIDLQLPQQTLALGKCAGA